MTRISLVCTTILALVSLTGAQDSPFKDPSIGSVVEVYVETTTTTLESTTTSSTTTTSTSTTTTTTDPCLVNKFYTKALFDERNNCEAQLADAAAQLANCTKANDEFRKPKTALEDSQKK